MFNGGNVISKEDAESVVLEYRPKKVNLDITTFARHYVDTQDKTKLSDFRMSDVIRIQTGVSDLEQKSVEERAEELVLDKLKVVEEKAYKEAFDLGLLDGKKEAFAKYEAIITKQVGELNKLMSSVTQMKKELVTYNEAHIVKLIYYMASRIAMTEIKENREAVLPVINSAIEKAQDDEDVVLRVSEADYNFLNTLTNETKSQYDFLEKVKLEIDPDLAPGGCVLETNYGVVDASIDERINRLWTIVSENTPKVRNKVESE